MRNIFSNYEMKHSETVVSDMEAYLVGGNPKYKFSQSKFRRSLSDARKREAESVARFSQQENRQMVLREMRHARGKFTPPPISKFKMVVVTECEGTDSSDIDYVEVYPEEGDISFSTSSEEEEEEHTNSTPQ